MTTATRAPPRSSAPPARPPVLPPRPPSVASYRPPPPPEPEPPGFHMSGTEVLHLGGSLAVLSVAFAFAFAHCQRGPLDIRVPDAAEINTALGLLPMTALIVLLGFLLHELAHKLVAQRLHLWAEFRASAGGLGMALVACVFTPIMFAAPGAVLIVGNATRRDGAHISIAGPATNLLIGFAFLPFVGSLKNPAEFGPCFGNFFQAAVLINAVLAIFNLLPFPPLDGSKIVRWSLPVYLGMLALAGLLFYVAEFGGL